MSIRNIIRKTPSKPIHKIWESFFNFPWEDWFLKRVRGLIIWYGWLFTALILLLILTDSSNTPAGLYILLLISFLSALFLTLIPLRWLEKVIPLTIPFYLFFIHKFLFYTGAGVSPYWPMYLIPLVLASLLFRYAGIITVSLFIMGSHLFLEFSNIGEVSIYLISYHFIIGDIPLFPILILLGVMLASMAQMLKADRDSLSRLFDKVEMAKKEWETSFDAIKDPILILDREHHIIMANGAAARMFNRQREEILGRKCYTLAYGTNSPISNCPHVSTMKTGQPSTIEIEEPRLGGIFEITAYPLFNEYGAIKGSVHYMKDITAQKTAEKALKRELEITRILHNTDKDILSTMNRKEILRLCIKNLQSLINTEYMSIAILDSEKDEFKIEVGSFLNRLIEQAETIPFTATILKTIISSRIPRYCPELSNEDLLPGDEEFRGKDIKSLLIVPMIAKGMPLGTLNLGSTEKNRFSEDDIELAEGYALQIAIAIDNSIIYERMQSLFMDTVVSLSTAIYAKSHWTQNHASEVANYTVAIAKELGLDESFIQDLRVAVLLHDIGKIGIGDTLLNKESPLTDEEERIMREHPLKGAEIIRPIKELKYIIPIIRHHHERWNGTGYPDGLSGNMIPIGARILNVADSFEAMRSDRPYKKGLTIEEAEQEIIKYSGIQFDPQMVNALVKVLEKRGL